MRVRPRGVRTKVAMTWAGRSLLLEAPVVWECEVRRWMLEEREREAWLEGWMGGCRSEGGCRVWYDAVR